MSMWRRGRDSPNIRIALELFHIVQSLYSVHVDVQRECTKMPILQKAATVKLFWLTKTDKGWRRFPCLYEQYLPGIRRPRAGWVSENGQQVHYPDGRFQTREYENGKTVWRNVLDAHG